MSRFHANGSDISRHAGQRLQGRAIPPQIVDLLHEFGASTRCGGADCLFFDKRGRRALTAWMGGRRGLKLIEPWLNVYAIVGDNGRLVTAGHRTGPIRRS